MTAPQEPTRDAMPSEPPTRVRENSDRSAETDDGRLDDECGVSRRDQQRPTADEPTTREGTTTPDSQPEDAAGARGSARETNQGRSDPFAQTVISNADKHEPCSPDAANTPSMIDTDLFKDLPVADLQQPETTTAGESSSQLARGDVGAQGDSFESRYEFLDELARGGLGRIWRARDKHIRREVAIKELLDRYQRHPSAAERFREEAQITGQLEHPSIVPIYDIAARQDGTCFYSMKLVQGVELHKAIAAFHALPGGSSEWLLTRNKLLRHFVAVCNAVAFAHDRGVLHRDLKPQNIMLGEFGETLVLDWGLAKVFDSPERVLPGRATDETAQLSGSGITSKPSVSSDARSSGSQTRVGSVMGTLAYMPPEQAAGQLDELDAWSDIYSLGAVLYQILTGRAPIPRAPYTEMVEQILDGNITLPREVDISIPKPLEAVVLKALSIKKENRYETALLLAAEIDQFLADEPVTAYPEPWHQKTYRWLKRHRTLASTVTAVLFVLGAGTWSWQSIEHTRLSDLQSQARERLAAAKQSQQLGDLPNASRLYRESLGLLQGEPSLVGLRGEIQTAADDVEQILDEQRRRRLARENFEGFLRDADEARFHGWLMASDTAVQNNRTAIETARRALRRYDLENSQALQPPPAYLSEDHIAQIRRVGYELMLLVANAELGTGWFEKENIPAAAESLLRWTDLAKHLGQETPAYYYSRAAAYQALGRPQKVRDELAAAKRLEPTTGLDFFLQGHVELQIRRDDQAALQNFLKTLDLEPRNYWAMHSAGDCQLQLGRYGEAQTTFSMCIALRPTFPWAYLMRGAARFESGDLANALADLNRAQQLDPKIYGIYVNRSRIFLSQADLSDEPAVKERHLAAARAELETAIQLQPSYAAAHINLAEVYRRQNNVDAAVEELNRAKELAPRDPRPYRLRGLIFLDQKKDNAALADFDRAQQLETAPEARAEDLRQIGSIHYRGGDFTAALHNYDAALQQAPSDGDLLRLRAETLLKLDRFEDAVTAFTDYLRHGPPLADVYRGRASAYAKLQRYREAVSDYTRALDLEPSSNMHARRGWALLMQSKALAAADFEEALKLQPENPDSYNGRGYVQVLRGNYSAAIADAEEALKYGGGAWQVVYNAGTIYSQAAARASADSARSAEERRRLQEQYSVRAIELIGEASELFGPANSSKFLEIVENDDALEPIRGVSEYDNLVHKLREGQ